MVDDEQATAITSRRRNRGPEASTRAGALECLKTLCHGGRRSETGGFPNGGPNLRHRWRRRVRRSRCQTTGRGPRLHRRRQRPRVLR
ncbi:hypothetical protein ACFX2F_028348 [Malus domestica]